MVQVVRRRDAVAAVLLIGALSGCSAPAPTEAALTGAWQDEYGSTALRLAAGGRCDADGLLTEQGPMTGRGRWQVTREDDAPAVELDFRDTPGSTVSQVDLDIRDGGRTLTWRDLAADRDVELHR